MKNCLKAFALGLPAVMLSITTFAATEQNTATAATQPVTVQAKMFTRDQLASALDTVVNNINKCNGDTECLKNVKDWNKNAMEQVKSSAVNFANTKLALQIVCGTNMKNQSVTTDANGKFTLTSSGSSCLIKGIEPKCGALEKDKKYPEAVNGAMLYCITGSDTKLKQTTKNLKDAIISAMKNAVMEKVKAGGTANQAPATTTTPTPAPAPANQ